MRTPGFGHGGPVGVAARLVVVLAVAGGGFALGYAVAPHHARTPARVVSTNAAARQAPGRTVSIHVPSSMATVPALAASKRARAPAHRVTPRLTGTTRSQSGGVTAHTSASHSSTATGRPQTRRTQPPTTPKTTTGTGQSQPTFNDGFTQQKPAPPNTPTSTGSESAAP